MPPAVEVRQRPMIGAMFKGPGPCYGLPTTVGYVGHDKTRTKAPGYSFGLKTEGKGSNKAGPGPAAYKVMERSTRFGADGTPKYTLHFRPKDPTIFRTPGPDAYRTEAVKIFKQPSPPSYSFGSRTRYHRKGSAPAPNAYTLPNMIGMRIPSKSAPPAFSMVGRPRVGGFSEDLQKTPGPGAYRDGDLNNWKKRSPIFSFGGRNMMPGDSTQKPGPGAYSPEKVYMTRRIAPKFSFGIRHSEYIAPLIEDVH